MVKFHFQPSFFLDLWSVTNNLVYQQSNIIGSKNSFAFQGLRKCVKNKQHHCLLTSLFFFFFGKQKWGLAYVIIAPRPHVYYHLSIYVFNIGRSWMRFVVDPRRCCLSFMVNPIHLIWSYQDWPQYLIFDFWESNMSNNQMV